MRLVGRLAAAQIDVGIKSEFNIVGAVLHPANRL